jgi:hypothetical protein
MPKPTQRGRPEWASPDTALGGQSTYRTQNGLVYAIFEFAVKRFE